MKTIQNNTRSVPAIFENKDIRNIPEKDLAQYISDFISNLEMTTKKSLDEITRSKTAIEVAHYLKSIKKLISLEEFQKIVRDEICTDKYLDRLVTSQVIISIVKSYLNSPGYVTALWKKRHQEELARARTPQFGNLYDTPEKRFRFYLRKFKSGTLSELEIEFSLSRDYDYYLREFGRKIGNRVYLIDPEKTSAIECNVRKKMKNEPLLSSFKNAGNTGEAAGNTFSRLAKGYIIREFFATDPRCTELQFNENNAENNSL